MYVYSLDLCKETGLAMIFVHWKDKEKMYEDMDGSKQAS
jgi:hypothetical protein